MKALNQNEKKIQKGISFPPDLFREIEGLRGRESRSSFVCRVLEKSLGWKRTK